MKEDYNTTYEREEMQGHSPVKADKGTADSDTHEDDFNLTTNCGELPFNLSSKIISRFKKFEKDMQKKGGNDYLLRDNILKDVKEAVRRLKAHFTPKDKRWMDVEMFSPREIIEFIDSKFGDKLTK